MCDVPDLPGWREWLGWAELPDSRRCTPAGPWIDLTHPLSPAVPRLASFPPPEFTRIAEMPASPLNVTRMESVVHIGTHVDSPCHFVPDGPAMEDVPLDRLMGKGVVVACERRPYAVIEPEHLERADPGIEEGDIVALDTGWAGRWGTPDWDRHPSLSAEAAQWLADRGCKLVALDVPTPDLPLDRRPPDFDWPAHRILLSHGVLIAEQVANLGSLAGSRVELVFGALSIAGSDGAPARAFGRRVAD